MSGTHRKPPPAGVRILGTGIGLPVKAVSNDELAKTVETSDEWIVQRTGIRQRYLCSATERCSDLATAALRMALKNSNLQPTDLDLVIVATMTPDMSSPTVACQVVANVGAVPCGAMEINLACTGFVAALNTGANFIRSGMYRNIAVIGAEKMSSIIDWSDRSVCVLFGDGAGAAILTGSDDPEQGCIYQAIHSDGGQARHLYIPRNPEDVIDPAAFTGKLGAVQMNGREVFKFAVHTFDRFIESAMKACDLTPQSVKMVIPHQSNIRILEAARDRLGFSPERVYINIERYGNTSAASVAICLHELKEQKRISPGDHVIFVGMGAGVTWATSVWKL